MQSHHSKGLLSAGSGPLYLALPSVGTTTALLALLFYTAFHVWLAVSLPPSPDELYFWVFSQQLQSGYFDNPPMVAFFIRISTAIFGDSIFAIRLPALTGNLLVFLSLLLLTPRTKITWLLLASPVALFGSVLMTTDPPLILFWMLYAIWFASTNATLDGWNQDPVTRVYNNSPVPWLKWIVGGVILGFGGLSKYTMLLAIPCGLVVLATRTRLRAWGLGYLLHLAVAGLLVLPVFIYNYQHDFAPFAFQWNHVSNQGVSFARLFEFLGTQTLLLGALPLLMLPWLIARRRDLCADARSQVYYWFFMLPYLYFLYRALRGHMEANWTFVAYLTFWPVADRLLSWTSFKGAVRMLLGISFAPAWIVSAAILVHLFYPLSFIQPHKDRVGVLQGQWDTAQQIADELRVKNISQPLLLPNYQWTSYFRYLRIPSTQLVPGGRASHYSLSAEPSCQGTEAWVVETSDLHNPAMGCFKNREVVRAYTVTSRNQPVSQVWLSRYSN